MASHQARRINPVARTTLIYQEVVLFSVSVVIPIRNERENLGPLLSEIDGVFRVLDAECELIVIDDGSTDGSQGILREALEQLPYLRVVELRKSFGQSAALDAGFRRARGDVIVTLDGDGQNDPRDIPLLLEALREGADLAVGWRKNRQDDFFVRLLPSRMANSFIRFMTGTELHDQGCALKAFRRDVISEIHLYGEMHRILGVVIEGNGFVSSEVVVNHRARVSGKSKYSLMRFYKVILDTFLVYFLRGYRTKPIHAFGGAGLMLFLSSFSAVAYSVWEKYALLTPIHRNPAFTIGLFLGVTAVQFFFMGLIAELLIRNYYETSDQVPHSVRFDSGFKEDKRWVKRAQNQRIRS